MTMEENPIGGWSHGGVRHEFKLRRHVGCFAKTPLEERDVKEKPYGIGVRDR
jgi:hypothetical protein